MMNEETANQLADAFVNTATTQVVIHRTEAPHSLQFRLAGPGTEVKIYGQSVKHLEEQVREIAESPDLPMMLQTIKARYTETK